MEFYVFTIFSIAILLLIIWCIYLINNPEDLNEFENYLFIEFLEIKVPKSWAIGFGKSMYNSSHHIKQITESNNPLEVCVGIQGSLKSRQYIKFCIAKSFLQKYTFQNQIIINNSKYCYVRNLETYLKGDNFDKANIIILKNIETNKYAYLQFHRNLKSTSLEYSYL